METSANLAYALIYIDQWAYAASAIGLIRQAKNWAWELARPVF